MEKTSTTRRLGSISLVLVVIGALNWLLVGLFKVDVVAAIFGALSPLSRIIYILIGAAGLYLIYYSRAWISNGARLGHPRSTAT
jgi:uncharacterized membrane protein YuzA (DUF378 family)